MHQAQRSSTRALYDYDLANERGHYHVSTSNGEEGRSRCDYDPGCGSFYPYSQVKGSYFFEL
jgi:hypothetical protein